MEDILTYLNLDLSLASQPDKRGRVPLHLAAKAGEEKWVKKLLELKTDMNKTDEKGTVSCSLSLSLFSLFPFFSLLSLSFSRLDAGMCRCVSVSPSLILLFSSGITPLMLACSRHNVDVIKLLINKGANVSVRDSGGKSAYDYVLQSKSKRGKEAAALLTEKDPSLARTVTAANVVTAGAERKREKEREKEREAQAKALEAQRKKIEEEEAARRRKEAEQKQEEVRRAEEEARLQAARLREAEEREKEAKRQAALEAAKVEEQRKLREAEQKREEEEKKRRKEEDDRKAREEQERRRTEEEARARASREVAGGRVVAVAVPAVAAAASAENVGAGMKAPLSPAPALPSPPSSSSSSSSLKKSSLKKSGSEKKSAKPRVSFSENISYHDPPAGVEEEEEEVVVKASPKGSSKKGSGEMRVLFQVTAPASPTPTPSQTAEKSAPAGSKQVTSHANGHTNSERKAGNAQAASSNVPASVKLPASPLPVRAAGSSLPDYDSLSSPLLEWGGLPYSPLRNSPKSQDVVSRLVRAKAAAATPPSPSPIEAAVAISEISRNPLDSLSPARGFSSSTSSSVLLSKTTNPRCQDLWDALEHTAARIICQQQVNNTLLLATEQNLCDISVCLAQTGAQARSPGSPLSFSPLHSPRGSDSLSSLVPRSYPVRPSRPSFTPSLPSAPRQLLILDAQQVEKEVNGKLKALQRRQILRQWADAEVYIVFPHLLSLTS